jgi:pimeloyl-ACP methyl ester carboxylesterase
MRRMTTWLVISLAVSAITAHAAGVTIRVPTREGVTTNVFWEETKSAKGTVLLLPGGGGGYGRIEDGKPQSGNFLVRSMQYFLDDGYNVAIFGRPTDMSELDYADRISEAHVADIRATLAFIKTKSPLPVWLVGTSRGSVSAAAAAIRIQADIAGIVLTSSVVNYKKIGAVPTQDLAAIKVPTFIMHHSRDACPICAPHEVGSILKGLKNAPIKRQLMVDGGSNPTGDPCEAKHWHGYIGMEREAVKHITDWLNKPTD